MSPLGPTPETGKIEMHGGHEMNVKKDYIYSANTLQKMYVLPSISRKKAYNIQIKKSIATNFPPELGLNEVMGRVGTMAVLVPVAVLIAVAVAVVLTVEDWTSHFPSNVETTSAAYGHAAAHFSMAVL
jgi:hypothetical protein